jgi:hypothetical protein
MIALKIDASDLIKVGNQLAKVSRDMPKYTAASINKGIDQGKPMAEGLISGRYNIGTPSLATKHASAGNLEGSIVGSGGMLPVSQFSPSESGKVVSVEIIKGSRKVISSSSRGPGISGAFMAGGRVMERRQAEKYPIFPVSTIGIPQMLGSKAVSNPARDYMTDIATGEVGRLFLGSIGK